jgi:tetratricopeptide (TPR) repeat protein
VSSYPDHRETVPNGGPSRKRRPKPWPVLLLASGAILSAQPAPVAGGVDEMLRQARQEIASFEKAGGRKDDPGHPAVKWTRELWKWRDMSPGSPDASKATSEAVRLLVLADRFPEVQARADLVPADDPAWQGLAPLLFISASRQKNFTYLFARLQSVFDEAQDPKTRAALQFNLGRAWRARNDEEKAKMAFRSAIELAGDSQAGKQAEAALYELLHLGVGQPAPSFSAAALGGSRLSLADYRGKPLVLVFWSTG